MGAELNLKTDRPVKQGKPSKDTKGNTVLVNPDGKAFAINRVLIEVWDKLDGEHTVEEVVEEVASEEDVAPDYEKKDLKEIVRRLYDANLAE